MKKRRILSLLTAIVLILSSILGYAPDASAAPANWADGITDAAAVQAKKAIWMDKSKTIDQRVEALLSVMTLSEKAAQMAQPEQNEKTSGAATPNDAKVYGLGSVLSGGGSPPKGDADKNSAQDWADRVNDYKAQALQSRLGIPLIYGVDAVHGNNNIDNTVIFPHNIGLGASGDAALAEKVGATAAEEIRATGIQWTFAPMLGVVYSERWGRFYESFGEKSDIVSTIGAASVRGLQGTGANQFAYNKVAATAKHYIGEGQTKNGANQGNIEMSAAAFDELMKTDGLLEPYKSAIEAGAKTVMVSYNSVNGLKCHGNKHLITDILKGAKTESNPLGLGFTGFVVTDYNGVDQLSDSTYNGKVASCINAGVDMFMEPYDWKNFLSAVAADYANGSVTAERIDDAVSRILRVKFEMGLFEEEVAGVQEKALLAKVGSAEHRAVAREAVAKSLTVLKNEKMNGGKTALEALQNSKNIMVGGYKANDIGSQCGGWTITWQGKSDSTIGGKKLTQGTTIYEGFKEVAGAGVKVSYNARGKIAAGSDAAVVVVGELPYAESDGDRTEAALVLSEADLNVIKTAKESAGDIPLVLVLMTGRPIGIAGIIDDFDAVVEAWLPGTEGAGIADVMLDSSKEFTGTLPVTWTWNPTDLTKKFTNPELVLFPNGTGLKKDGTSIKAGGQTSIPAQRPAVPVVTETKKRDGGVDIDYYGGKLEGELMNPTTGTFNSWNVGTGTETVGSETIGYGEWTSGSWGNAKWKLYFRQAGTYKVTARVKVDRATTSLNFGIQANPASDFDNTPVKVTHSVTTGYQIIDVGTVTVATTGIYGAKLIESLEAARLNMKLDYLQFDLVTPNPSIPKDESEDDAGPDPADETVLPSNSSLIMQNAVDVFMSSTENSQSMNWYKFPVNIKNQMTKKDSLGITSVDNQNLTTINVNPNKEYQEILGFGTSLEESSVGNLIELDEDVREQFLRDLVNPKKGGMTLFRVTIGTSDFTGRDFYTYYDAKTLTKENAIEENGQLKPDWYNTTGKGFSIQKDRDYKVIQIIKQVQRIAKEYGVENEVKFFASSWTPPGWMKNETSNSKSYAKNDLLLKGGSLSDEHIDDLAMYYTRYLEEYAKEGIELYAMTLQNEPMLEINYPSCSISGQQEGKMLVAIKKAVNNSAVLNAKQKNVKLWAFDHNPGDAAKYVSEILKVSGANDALDGIAFHDYGGSLTNMQTMLDTILNQGDKKDQTVNLTERSVWGTYGANQILTYLRNSAISYNSWVTMLDSNIAKHQWVGTPDPTMFTRAAGSDNDYWATPEFYMSGQFSRFIRPGFIRVDSNLGSTATITNVVFKNPETKELIAVVVNQTKTKQDFKFVTNGVQFIGAVPAGNIATYVWKEPENMHSNPEEWFPAKEYTRCSDGVSVATDEAVKTNSNDDYIDYIIRVKEAGLYNITFDQKPASATSNARQIQVYQGDNLLQTIVATEKWDLSKANVQGAINFEQAGYQQIRIKATPGVNINRIKVEKAKDIHQLPGKINAPEYFKISGAGDTGVGRCTISDAGIIENSGAGNTYYYKVNAPENDTYQLSLRAAVVPENSNIAGYGFVVNVDGTDAKTMVNGAAGADGNFNVGWEWGNFILTTTNLTLTKGEHIIGIRIPKPINMASLSIGSYMDLKTDGNTVVEEGKENSRVITATVAGGVIDDTGELDAANPVGYWRVTNLPKGVTASAVKKSDTVLEVTLTGNRLVDFDQDKTIGVDIVTKPTGTANSYPTNTTFKIKANNDEESLKLADGQDLDAPATIGETKKVQVKIEGGTFNEAAIGNIVVAGDAKTYYTVKPIKFIDINTIEIELTYNKQFYRAMDLNVTVPQTAYADSTDGGALDFTISMKPVNGLPTAIELKKDVAAGITLTESMAFENKGSLAASVQTGNYVDYFLDVKEKGIYTITYTVATLTSNGTSYPNALDVNRGVPGEIGTNSYKQVSLPALWTTANVLMKQTIELEAGQQTIEFKAKSAGYKIASINIAPINVETVNLTVGNSTTISATKCYDVYDSHAIINNVFEYTVKGTAFDYKLNVVNSGEYTIAFNYGIESSGSVKFKVDRLVGDKVVPLGVVDAPATGAWSTLKDTAELKLDLPEGEYTVRVTLVGDGANLKQMSIKYTKETVIPLFEEVTSVTLDKTSDEVKVGDSIKLEPVFVPSNATIKDLTWSSSNPRAATVSSNGTVTAIGVGEAIITAVSVSNPDAKVEFTIKVIPVLSEIQVTSLPSKTTYLIGEAFAASGLVVTAKYENAEDVIVTNYTLTGFDSSVEGKKTITVSYGGKTTAFDVTITKIADKPTVIFNRNDYAVKAGEQVQLAITKNTASDKVSSYTVLNTAIAKVDQNGKVTGLKEGKTKVTVKMTSGATATCNLTVVKGKVPEVQFSKTMVKKQKYNMNFKNVLKKTKVTFKSSKPKVAKISKKGVITAVKKGTTTITATITQNNQQYKIKVKLKVVNSGKKGSAGSKFKRVSKTKKAPVFVLTQDMKKKGKTAFKVANKNLTTQVSYKSSKKKVATVDKKGNVKAVKKGKATITATVKQNGITYTFNMNVIVK